MTATDELRRLLDERGVEWEACRVPTLRSELAATFWYDRDGNPRSAVEGADDVPDGMLSVQANLTPEQAIEATLGRGTCHSDNNPPLLYDDPFRVFRCSECHHKVDLRRNPKPNYCPNCGRKVVDE